MNALLLNDYRQLFRDDEAFRQFVSLLEGAANQPTGIPVWVNRRHVATLFSPASAKSVFQSKLLDVFVEKPELLDKLRGRLDNDHIVEGIR